MGKYQYFQEDEASIQRLIKAISLSPDEVNTLNHLKIYHGTESEAIESILKGPLNQGRGFGGAGLYVDLDPAVAKGYAFNKTQFRGQAVVLEGSLNLTPNARVARIRIAERGKIGSANLKEGIFPSNWFKDKKLQRYMHDNFDMIEVLNSAESGYATGTNRFLVVHKRAGTQSLDWSCYYKEGKVYTLRQNAHPFQNFAAELEEFYAIKRLPDYTQRLLALPDYHTPVNKMKSNPARSNLRWYTKLARSRAGKIVFEGFHSVLHVADGYVRYQQEREHYPRVSFSGQLSSAVTSMLLDVGLYEVLHWVMRPTLAIGSLMVLNELSHLAHENRGNKIEQKRHILTKLLDLYEMNPEAQHYLLNDFDRGGQASRKFIENAYYAGLPLQKALEYYHDVKEVIIGLGRSAGHRLREPEEGTFAHWLYGVGRMLHPSILGVLSELVEKPADRKPSDDLMPYRYQTSLLSVKFLEEQPVPVSEDFIGVINMLRKNRQLPVNFMNNDADIPVNAPEEAVGNPEVQPENEAVLDEEALHQAENALDEKLETNKEKLEALQDALELIDDVNKLGGGFFGGWLSDNHSPLAAAFRADHAEKSYKNKVKVDTFYQGLHRAYLSYKSVERSSTHYARYQRDLIDQVGIAKRLFNVDPLEYLASYPSHTMAGAFSQRLASMSTSSWQLDFMEQNRKLTEIKSQLEEVKTDIARYEAHQTAYGNIQAGLKTEVDVIHDRIEALLKNPALQFLDDWAGLNGYIKKEIKQEHDVGEKNKIRSLDKEQEEKMDEMDYQADKADDDLHEAFEKLADEQRNFGRVGEIARDISASRSMVGLNLKHLENQYFDLKMQQINISFYFSSPNATIKAMSELHEDLIGKEGKKQSEYDALDVKKSAWEKELEEENKKPLGERDPIKIKRLETDVEDAAVKLGDIRCALGGIDTNKKSLEREQERAERQKPIRQKIYDLKMGAIKKQFPEKTDEEIEKYLSDQGALNELYQLELKNIMDETHGYHAVLGSATQLVSSIASFMGHELGLKWMTPEVQADIEGVLNCANRLFDIGVTIANMSVALERAFEGGFGLQNILTTIFSPGIGVFNAIFVIIRGFHPLPNPVLEGLKSLSKQMAEGFKGLGEGVNQLGKMSQLLLGQNQQMMVMLQEGFYHLSLVSKNSELSQTSRLSEIKRQLNSMVVSTIEAPHHTRMTDVESRSKSLSDVIKARESKEVIQKAVRKFNLAMRMNVSAEIDRVSGPYQSSQSELYYTHADTLIKPHMQKAGLAVRQKQQLPLRTTLFLNAQMISQGKRASARVKEDLRTGNLDAAMRDNAVQERLAFKSLVSRSKALRSTYEDLRAESVFREAYLSVIDEVEACYAIMNNAVSAANIIPELRNDKPDLKKWVEDYKPHQYSDLQLVLFDDDKRLRAPLSAEAKEAAKRYTRVWKNEKLEHSYKGVVEKHEDETWLFHEARYRKPNSPGYFGSLLGESYHKEQASQYFDLKDRGHDEYVYFSDRSKANTLGLSFDYGLLSESCNIPSYASFFNAPHKYVYRMGGMDYRKRQVKRVGDVQLDGKNQYYARIPLFSMLTSGAVRGGDERDFDEKLDKLRSVVMHGGFQASLINKIDIKAHQLMLAREVCFAFILGFMQLKERKFKQEFDQVAGVLKKIREMQAAGEDSASLCHAYEAFFAKPEILDYCAGYISKYLEGVMQGKLPMGRGLLQLLILRHENSSLHGIQFSTDNAIKAEAISTSVGSREVCLFSPWYNPFIIDCLTDPAVMEDLYNQRLEKVKEVYQACVRYLESKQSGCLSQDQQEQLKQEAILVYPEGKGSDTLIPLLVKKADLQGFMAEYSRQLRQGHPGMKLKPDTELVFRYLVERDKKTGDIIIGLHLYAGSSMVRLTKGAPFPYRQINKQTFSDYLPSMPLYVTLGEVVSFSETSRHHLQKLNVLLMQLQSPFTESYLPGSEVYATEEDAYGLSRYFKIKNGASKDKFEDNFERWEDCTYQVGGVNNKAILKNPVKLPFLRVRSFPGLFQTTEAHGKTVVFSHQDFTADAASAWSHPQMRQSSLMGVSLMPLSKEMMDTLALPDRSDLVSIRNDEQMVPALLKLKAAIYRFLGLFALAGKMSRHQKILDQLHITNLLKMVDYHHTDHEIQQLDEILHLFVSANGETNALLNTLLDYHRSVIEMHQRGKLIKLGEQTRVMEYLQAQSVSRVSQGLFSKPGSSQPASPAAMNDDDSGVLNVGRVRRSRT